MADKDKIDETEYSMFRRDTLNNPAIMAQIGRMPEDEREAYIRNLFRDYKGESEVLNEQVAQADALRNSEGPQGRYTHNAYTAANPLEHLNQGIRGVKGEIDYAHGMDAKKAMSADKTATMGQTGQNMLAAALRQQSMAPEEAIAKAKAEQERQALMQRQGW